MPRDHAFDYYIFTAINKARCNTLSNQPATPKKKKDMLNISGYGQNRAISKPRPGVVKHPVWWNFVKVLRIWTLHVLQLSHHLTRQACSSDLNAFL